MTATFWSIITIVFLQHDYSWLDYRMFQHAFSHLDQVTKNSIQQIDTSTCNEVEICRWAFHHAKYEALPQTKIVFAKGKKCIFYITIMPFYKKLPKRGNILFLQYEQNWYYGKKRHWFLLSKFIITNYYQNSSKNGHWPYYILQGIISHRACPSFQQHILWWNQVS